MISDKEFIARILKPNWIIMGKVSSAAFNLRPQISENYISVLRENESSFKEEAKRVSKEKIITYASMEAKELRSAKPENIDENVVFDVMATDNEHMKSHAGIFVFINGKQYYGGMPPDTLELKKGIPAELILIESRRALAKIAQKNIKTI